MSITGVFLFYHSIYALKIDVNLDTMFEPASVNSTKSASPAFNGKYNNSLIISALTVASVKKSRRASEMVSTDINSSGSAESLKYRILIIFQKLTFEENLQESLAK